VRLRVLLRPALRFGAGRVSVLNRNSSRKEPTVVKRSAKAGRLWSSAETPPLLDPGPAAGLPRVVVRETVCRSVLNQSSISDYSLNCYTGCTNGCVYCYARFMQRFHPHAEPWGAFSIGI
jgi:hypothetical protein